MTTIDAAITVLLRLMEHGDPEVQLRAISLLASLPVQKIPAKKNTRQNP